MYRKLTMICIILIMIVNSVTISTIFAGEDGKELEITSKSALIMEAVTGKIIYEKNAHERLKPASVTKIMTILLIYDAFENGNVLPEEEVVISEYAASMGGSQVFLEANEVQTAETLLKCIVVASANDGAVAMAERIAGSEEAFAGMMNERAKGLGMENTHFENASGLDHENHYTSAYDIALMSRELTTKYPEVFELTQIWTDSIIHTTRRGNEEFGLTNTNKLLQWYEGATGLKTGSTSKALYCLSGTATRNDMDIIAVVMAAPDYKTRFREVMKLFDYGFANCRKYSDTIVGEIKEKVVVKKGVVDEILAVPKSDFNIVFTDRSIDLKEIVKEIILEEDVAAPIEEGQVLGSIQYKYKDKSLGSVELIATEGVEEATFKFYLGKAFSRYLLKGK